MKKLFIILPLTILFTACSLDSLDPGKVEVPEDKNEEEILEDSEVQVNTSSESGEYEKEMPDPGIERAGVDLESLDSDMKDLQENSPDNAPAAASPSSIIGDIQYPADLEGCSSLEDANQKAACEFNILNALAETEANPAHCDGISAEDLKESCIQNAENIESF